VLRDANAGAGGALKISKCGIFAVLKMVLEITAGRARVENNYGRLGYRLRMYASDELREVFSTRGIQTQAA